MLHVMQYIFFVAQMYLGFFLEIYKNSFIMMQSLTASELAFFMCGILL